MTTPSETVTLLPCAFCGKPGDLINFGRFPDEAQWSVRCNNQECPACPYGHSASEGEAIAAWNRRLATPPEPKGDRVERVTKASVDNLKCRSNETFRQADARRFLAMLDAALPPQAPAPDINEMVRKIRTLKRDERCEFPLSWERGGYNQGLEDAIQIMLEAAAKRSEG